MKKINRFAPTGKMYGGRNYEPAAREKGKTLYAAYWTTIEKCERTTVVQFRFPLQFGMLRAADWAEKEIIDAADWMDLQRCGSSGYESSLSEAAKARMLKQRLRFMMPLYEGHCKVLHRCTSMTLSVGMNQLQIEMAVDESLNANIGDAVEEAMDRMAAWMRENAYQMQMN